MSEAVKIMWILGAAFFALVGIWTYAEFRWGLRVRLLIGVLIILLIPVVAFYSHVLTQIDDNSYYGTGADILIDETMRSLDTGDPTLRSRLGNFKDNYRGSYAKRGGFLEAAREFEAKK